MATGFKLVSREGKFIAGSGRLPLTGKEKELLDKIVDMRRSGTAGPKKPLRRLEKRLNGKIRARMKQRTKVWTLKRG